MVLIFFGLIALFLVVKSFRMPEDFRQNQQIRSDIRKKMIVSAQENTQSSVDETQEDQIR
jgi:hypothetical protein